MVLPPSPACQLLSLEGYGCLSARTPNGTACSTDTDRIEYCAVDILDAHRTDKMHPLNCIVDADNLLIYQMPRGTMIISKICIKYIGKCYLYVLYIFNDRIYIDIYIKRTDDL